MPAIGDRTVNLFTVDRDETAYTGATHSTSHRDTVTIRRTLPSSSEKPTGTSMTFQRGFASTVEGKPEPFVTVKLSMTVPSGMSSTDAKAYVKDTLLQAADQAGELSISGDIHL